MQALILGCGYVGKAFGRHLAGEGTQVFGTCRRPTGFDDLIAAGIKPVLFNGTPTEELSQIAADSDIILASIPPNDEGDPAFGILEAVLRQKSDAWIGYLSTTGVYGDRRGGWAFEDDALTPQSIEAKRRAFAEGQWASLPNPAHIFRLPGIYGPGRSAIEQVKKGTARWIDMPEQVFSRAHRDDIVSAINASIARPHAGRVYNVCDDLPCASGDVILHACKLLGVAPPPPNPHDSADLSDAARRFYLECKRVSNARAKSELAWQPRFPTYNEGLADCLARQ